MAVAASLEEDSSAAEEWLDQGEGVAWELEVLVAEVLEPAASAH